MQRVKGTTAKHHLSLDSACDQRHWQKERDSLTMEFHFGIGAQHIPQRPGNTLMMKKNVLDFHRKKGAGHGEKRLKDMF